jgi:hypothetical protein
MTDNGGDEDKAMRQELIEEAVALLNKGDSDGLRTIGPIMKEQEKRYAIGVIEDMRDDALNAVMGWAEKQSKEAGHRRK